MERKIIKMTNYMCNKWLKNDITLDELAHSFVCVKSDGSEELHCFHPTETYTEMLVTKNFVRRAKKIFKIRREEMLESYKQPNILTADVRGTLYCDSNEMFVSRFPRMYFRFFDNSARRQHVVISGVLDSKGITKAERGFWVHITHVDDYNDLDRKIRDHNEACGSSMIGYIDCMKWSKMLMPYSYQYKETNYHFTKKGVIDFINQKFGTTFLDLVVDHFFLNYDDYVNWSNPKLIIADS